MLVFIAVSLVGIFGAAYIKYRVRKALPIDFASVEFAAGGGIKAEKVRYTGTRKGRTEWELEAETAAYTEADETTRLEDVKVIFYSANGDEVANYTMTSDKGSYDSGNGLIEVSGDVVVTSPDGYDLKTDRLVYSEKTGEISTKEYVLIKSEKMTVAGTGLVVEIESERLSLLSGVRAEFRDGLF